MKLDFIPLDRLSVSKTNMRHARRAPDVSDILPTVRSRGVLQPILVRLVTAAAAPRAAEIDAGEVPGAPPDHYEIVAGSRRFHAARLIAAEQAAAGDPSPEPGISLLPCAILDTGDDAAAIEASMIENMARLDPDEVTQWENFTRLVKEGRGVCDIAATFGLPDLTVRRVLALGNLLPAIRTLYRKERIDATTVRHLTMASKSQQKAWLALAEDENAYVPTGHQLKAWLFGGASIAVRHALFDVAASGLVTVADLFGEDHYAADVDAFWSLQNDAVEARRAAYVEQGWADAVVMPPTTSFSAWEYTKAPKRKGGRVYLDVRATGEVIVHEGYVTSSEARRLAKGEEAGGPSSTDKPARGELTSTLQTYVDLHRHAAVRAALTGHPAVALRLMVAHAIGGSDLWRVSPEPQSTRHDHVRDSIDNSRAEADFDERRRAMLALLGFDPEEPTVTGGSSDDGGVVGIFARLLDLPDPCVMDVIAIVMGETLGAGSPAVDAVALRIGIDMTHWWQADDAFFTLLRDREVMLRIVAEVAGENIAVANAKEKTSVMKTIVRDTLDGTNGRARCDQWVPRWMAFPPSAYTERGGVGTVHAHARALAALGHGQLPDDQPAPAARGGKAVAAVPDDAGERLAA